LCDSAISPEFLGRRTTSVWGRYFGSVEAAREAPPAGAPLGAGRRIPVPAIRQALVLLPTSERRRLLLVSVVQMSLGILDLIGIALVGLVATAAVSGVQRTAWPGWMQSLLDPLGLGGLTNSQLVGLFGALAAIALIGKTAASAYMSRRVIRFLARQQADVSARLARELLARPLLDVQRWSTAEVLYSLSAGVGAAVIGILGSSVMALAELFLFGIIAVSLFIVDPALTLMAGALFGLIVFLLQVVLGRMSAANARRLADSAMGTTSAVQEALSTYREATVLNRRELYVDRFEKLVRVSAHATGGNQYILEVPKYVLETTLIVASFGVAIVQFLTKDLLAAATTVAVFLTSGFRIIPALLRLQAAGINIRNGAEGARTTFELAGYLHDNPNHPEVDVVSPLPQDVQELRRSLSRGHLDFTPDVFVDDVSVTYPDSSNPAIMDVTLHVPAGKSAALVGSTGAGKSTLADVILGVLHPDRGTVRVGGVSPRHAIAQWPGGLAYVPQTVALVDGTVRDNVALGLPTEAVDDAQVWEALSRAHLADFLRDARDGLDTHIGERGIRLSGGQRQRLGIARALYTRPLLLVLDEATSALDAETEQAIGDTLRSLEGTVTTVTIAHRLATIRAVDTVYYLEKGRIAAFGTFEEVRSQVHDFDRAAALLGL
jgi:ABC-type multidrug transport system fused ATPase/permease subunit